MAVETWRVFEAVCDRCEQPHQTESVQLTETEAYAAAVQDGWLRQGDEAIYCPSCVALAGAA
jgi:late competence protein required for DNA uptake (superfamily II DNA/RNA helicase)